MRRADINALRCCLPIVHSKNTEPWGVFDFFQMFSKIIQFSLFQCLKDAFVLLTFQFQVYSTLGKQLSFFRAKISGFAFSPTSNRSLQVCVVHIPYSIGAQRPVADDFALQLHWCDAERTTAKPRYVLVQKRIPELFLSKQTCFFESAPLLSIWRRASGFRRSSLPRFVTLVDREDWCFWNQ